MWIIYIQEKTEKVNTTETIQGNTLLEVIAKLLLTIYNIQERMKNEQLEELKNKFAGQDDIPF